MDDPLVSIIIPVFNAEKYLSECIESVMAQTWPYKEIIIVNDGSTDGSLKIAQQYECDWIRIFQQENKGASAARNKGLNEAKGEYIQFMDADDMLRNNKIQNQVQHLKYHEQCIAVCDTIHFYDPKEITGDIMLKEWYHTNEIMEPVDFLVKLYGGEIIGKGYGGMIQPNAWLVPKKVVDLAGPWNEELSLDDDGEYFCRIILASSGIIYCPGTFNYYRKFKQSHNLSAGKTAAAAKSLLSSASLKAMHISAATNLQLAKMAMGRVLNEVSFILYPAFPALSFNAKKQADALYPGFKFRPYKKGIKKYLSGIFGWKPVKYIDYLRFKS